MNKRVFPAVIVLAPSVFATCMLVSMGQIVPSTLQHYRLQLSYEGANPCLPLLKITQALLGVTMITIIAGTTLVLRNFLSTRKPRFRASHAWGPSLAVAVAMLCLGAIALGLSIVYTESIFAFIGLSLTFWGALLLFIRPKKYVPLSLLDSIATSSLETINQIIDDLGYNGKAVYLPPRYSKNLQEASVFIAFESNVVVPPLEKATEEVPMVNPKGIFLRPPGLHLTNLCESKLRKDFTKVDLAYLQRSLPKLLVEDLEIADDFQMNVNGDLIRVKVIGSVFNDPCSEAMKLSSSRDTIGCHLSSSIAVALARASAKPIIIQETKVFKDSNIMEVCYRIVEE